MKFRFPPSLGLVLLISLFASAGALRAQTRIMLLGDSLTAQEESRRPLYDRLKSEGYAFEFVGSQGSAPLLHEGHGGFTIGPDQSRPGNLAANIAQWIPAARPDLILLLVGNNDFNGKPGVDPAGAPARLEALLEHIAALAPQAEIIVCTGLKIAFIDDYEGPLNRQIPGIVEKLRTEGRKVHLADLNAEVVLAKGAPPYNGPDSDYIDGTHLNARGGAKLADARYAHLVPFLKKPEN